MRSVLLRWQILGLLGQAENIDGVDLARYFVGDDGGVRRDRKDHGKNECRQTDNGRNLHAHPTSPRAQWTTQRRPYPARVLSGCRGVSELVSTVLRRTVLAGITAMAGTSFLTAM